MTMSLRSTLYIFFYILELVEKTPQKEVPKSQDEQVVPSEGKFVFSVLSNYGYRASSLVEGTWSTMFPCACA